MYFFFRTRCGLRHLEMQILRKLWKDTQHLSFALDDVLFTAASDSEDFRPDLADALPPSGQEARLSAQSSWTCFCVPLKSSPLIGPTSLTNLSHLNSTSGALAAQIQGLNGGSYSFSAICITRSPDPGNSLSPPALLTWQTLPSPT